MKIDLRRLYAFNKLDIDEEIIIPEEKYLNMGVKSFDKVKVCGKVIVNYEENIELEINVKGSFIMPCAVTLEDVNCPFECDVEEEIDENSLKNEFYLDLLDILWENIVLEIPVRVVKEGVKLESQKGNGWEIVSED